MKQYQIRIRETRIHIFDVEAKDKAQAREIAEDIEIGDDEELYDMFDSQEVLDITEKGKR